MIIEKRCGNSVELELEVRRLSDNFLVDLADYTISALLSDGMGGNIRKVLLVEKLTALDQRGRFKLTVLPAQTQTLIPSTYDIDVTYVEIETGYTESLKTIYLKLSGL